MWIRIGDEMPTPKGNAYIKWGGIAAPQPAQIKSLELCTRGFYKSWHRAIFPGSLPPSIVAADRLYLRVRDGNGCVPVAWAPRTF